MTKPTEAEFNDAIKALEEKTCYRMTAKTDVGSAFFVPVTEKDNPMAPAFEMSWKQIKAVAALPRPEGM